ncbi:MAG TPA: ornithine carbamoyltransferase [Deltaproteobacteria bacterium]|nr:ornithine carbamoyltransferase [Deltaproteobacteria bacterium]
MNRKVVKRDFTRFLDITEKEARYLLKRAVLLKKMKKSGSKYKPLKDKTLAMIFEKASTRTRVSFEVGMRELGGNSIFLTAQESQIGRGEPVKDTARVLSRYTDVIVLRTYSQRTIEEFAQWSTVPIINGLSDLYHPCQILSDLLTITEFKGGIKDINIAYIGDGNNIANSWIEAAILLKLNLVVATPPGYKPEWTLVERAKKNNNFHFTHDPQNAIQGADVVNTDVWVSMGQEKESRKRKKAFASYTVNEKLLQRAKQDVIIMHCLPAHRGEEITEEVFERFQQVIFSQAENRLHAQKALLEWIITRNS